MLLPPLERRIQKVRGCGGLLQAPLPSRVSRAGARPVAFQAAAVLWCRGDSAEPLTPAKTRALLRHEKCSTYFSSPSCCRSEALGAVF